MRLGRGWRELAAHHITAYWHYRDYRYLDARTLEPRRVAEIAASAMRERLNSAYRYARQHPRSVKAHADIIWHTRELVRIGRHLLWSSGNVS